MSQQSDQREGRKKKFLRGLREERDKIIDNAKESLSEDGQVILAEQNLLSALRIQEASLEDRDAETATALAATADLMNQFMALKDTREKANQGFDEFFNTRLDKAEQLRIDSQRSLSGFAEKLIVTGVGSLGLSATLFGLESNRNTSDQTWISVSLILLTWTFFFASLIVAIIAHLRVTRVSNATLNFYSDLAIEHAKQDNNRHFHRKPADRSTVPKERKADQMESGRSRAWIANDLPRNLGSYAAFLLLTGYLFLLTYLFLNIKTFRGHVAEPPVASKPTKAS